YFNMLNKKTAALQNISHIFKSYIPGTPKGIKTIPTTSCINFFLQPFNLTAECLPFPFREVF
ncbi:hypothetical protein VU07_03500, partial [Desulfobulbus sp. F4]|nr:hypothetical protein [Desulfobulbus sp. F4]